MADDPASSASAEVETAETAEETATTALAFTLTQATDLDEALLDLVDGTAAG